MGPEADGGTVTAGLLAIVLIAYAMVYSGVRKLQGFDVTILGSILGYPEVKAGAEAATSSPSLSGAVDTAIGNVARGAAGAIQASKNPVGAAVVQAARSYLGQSYRYGAVGTVGQCEAVHQKDCSSLTMCAYYKGAHITLPRTAAAQLLVCQRITRADLVPGDLVFWFHPISHVAIYIGNNQIIAAPRPGQKVEVETLWGSPVAYGRPRAATARHGHSSGVA